MFWILVVATGLIGAMADIAISKWAEQNTARAWSIGAVAILVFMTLLGLVIRTGNSKAYPLSVVVTIVVVLNIVALILWDLYSGKHLSALQFGGILLALIGVACLELGK